ncbi:19346_t:CDS:2, partial [Dentiscutata erythropus]
PSQYSDSDSSNSKQIHYASLLFGLLMSRHIYSNALKYSLGHNHALMFNYRGGHLEEALF